MVKIKSVLIADEIENECIETLKQSGVQVYKKTKLSESQLITELKKFDCVIVRSSTKVIILQFFSLICILTIFFNFFKITRAVIEANSSTLKLIGRAGTGVDNIDVSAATKNGILVMNTPGYFYTL